MRNNLRSILAALACFTCLAAHAANSPAEEGPVRSSPAAAQANPTISALNTARLFAVGDSVTTYFALQGAAHETNPLINTSPAGLVALTAIKLGLLQYVDTLPSESRRTALKATTALWSGAVVNNILVKLSVTGTPMAPVALGVLAGYWMWQHQDETISAEEKLVQAAPIAYGRDAVVP